MLLTNEKAHEPKNHKAATNQAAQVQLIILDRQRKRGNLMKRKTELEAKIKKLEEESQKLMNQIEKLDKDSESYETKINELKTRFDLTDLEIQEARLAIIKRNLERQEALRAAGLSPDQDTLV